MPIGQNDCLEYLNCREQAESLSDRTPGVRIWSISAFRVYRRNPEGIRLGPDKRVTSQVGTGLHFSDFPG